MKSNRAAILLIGIGALLLMLNLLNLGGQSFLFVVGAVFIGFYAATEVRHERGSVGLLIPGTILLSIGTFATLEHFFILGRYETPIFFLLLGTAFLLIHLIHYVRHGFRHFFSSTWAFIVTVILYGLAVMNLFYRFYNLMLPHWIRDNVFAMILILVGIVLVFTTKNRK